MKILSTFNRLRRTLGLNDFTPNYSDDDQTQTAVINEIQDNELTVEDQTNLDVDLSEIEQIEIDEYEKQDLDDEFNESYIQYSPEVVGFANRELQWNAYRTIISYTGTDDSFIDFGCGRGDFIPFFMSEYNATPNYIGIDMNDHLIKAGSELYPDSELMSIDWFKLDADVQRDWAINVGSCNLRYDADTVQSDDEYTKNTIRKMFAHASKGVVVMLASSLTKLQDGLIEHNPGDIFNWAQQEFGNVALDHSLSDDVFCLIIYK